MRANGLAFLVALGLLAVVTACSTSAPLPSASSTVALKSPTTATPTAVAPDIPAADAEQTLCFDCHGPGELPSIPDHSVMQDGRAICEQCHRQEK